MAMLILKPRDGGKSAARTHALTIASATHLHRAGHLPEVTKSRIHAKARAALNGMRKGAPARPVQAFGSLAPDVEQDGM